MRAKLEEKMRLSLDHDKRESDRKIQRNLKLSFVRSYTIGFVLQVVSVGVSAVVLRVVRMGRSGEGEGGSGEGLREDEGPEEGGDREKEREEGINRSALCIQRMFVACQGRKERGVYRLELEGKVVSADRFACGMNVCRIKSLLARWIYYTGVRKRYGKVKVLVCGFRLKGLFKLWCEQLISHRNSAIEVNIYVHIHVRIFVCRNIYVH